MNGSGEHCVSPEQLEDDLFGYVEDTGDQIGSAFEWGVLGGKK